MGKFARALLQGRLHRDSSCRLFRIFWLLWWQSPGRKAPWRVLEPCRVSTAEVNRVQSSYGFGDLVIKLAKNRLPLVFNTISTSDKDEIRLWPAASNSVGRALPGVVDIDANV